jgi:hypothetical protein
MQNQQGAHSYRDAFAITPGATALQNTTNGLLATVAGNVTVVTQDEWERYQKAPATYVVVPVTLPISAGVPLALRVVKVPAATATGLFGLV